MELLYVVGGLIVLTLLWRGVSWLREFQRRVRVRLIGQSERAPEGKSAPSRFDLSTNIVFRNNESP